MSQVQGRLKLRTGLCRRYKGWIMEKEGGREQPCLVTVKVAY